jgi:UPF0755 protein
VRGSPGPDRYHYRLSPTLTSLKVLVRLVVLLLFAVAAAWGGIHEWARRPLVSSDTSARLPDVVVAIPVRSSVRAIADQVAAAGLPLNDWLFTALARIERRATRLQAGTYAIPPSITPEQLLVKLESGDVMKVALVIPEGWTFAQMRNAIAHDSDIRQTVADADETALMGAVGAGGTRAEGQFFPDTYVFTPGTTDLDLYKRAYRAMQKHLADAWASRAADLPLTTPYEALTLASVIEKETGRPEDRPQVAAVFVNRLRRGMPLQTDPTVIYGLGPRFDGNLRKIDLTTDTPYNTYTRTGLPPTPIALVGVASLAAVVNPPHSDALYFVARGDGTSEFSSKLGDHNRAVDRYQRAPARGRP